MDFQWSVGTVNVKVPIPTLYFIKSCIKCHQMSFHAVTHNICRLVEFKIYRTRYHYSLLHSQFQPRTFFGQKIMNLLWSPVKDQLFWSILVWMYVTFFFTSAKLINNDMKWSALCIKCVCGASMCIVYAWNSLFCNTNEHTHRTHKSTPMCVRVWCEHARCLQFVLVPFDFAFAVRNSLMCCGWEEGAKCAQ